MVVLCGAHFSTRADHNFVSCAAEVFGVVSVEITISIEPDADSPIEVVPTRAHCYSFIVEALADHSAKDFASSLGYSDEARSLRMC